jgi:hypothetical protein
MIEFSLPEKDILFPETWDELTFEQLQWIVENYMLKLPHMIQVIEEDKQPEIVSAEMLEQLNLLLVWKLSGLPMEEFIELPPLDVDRMMYVDTVHSFIMNKPGPLKNPLQTIGLLRGPADSFDDLSTDEFFCANTFLENYDTLGDEKHFNLFLATLYRPAEKNGSRPEFKLNGLEKEAEKVRITKMTTTQRMIIRLWFIANLTELRDSNPNAFSGKSNSEGDFVELMLQLAKDGPFGKFQEVQRTNVALVMKELDRISKEAEKLK